jgi:hypothetical protein
MSKGMSTNVFMSMAMSTVPGYSTGSGIKEALFRTIVASGAGGKKKNKHKNNFN